MEGLTTNRNNYLYFPISLDGRSSVSIIPSMTSHILLLLQGIVQGITHRIVHKYTILSDYWCKTGGFYGPLMLETYVSPRKSQHSLSPKRFPWSTFDY